MSEQEVLENVRRLRCYALDLAASTQLTKQYCARIVNDIDLAIKSVERYFAKKAEENED